MRNGVPWDVATTMPEDEVLAFFIIFGEIDGGSWDWTAGRWRKRTTP